MTLTQRSSAEHMAVSFARVLRGAGLSVPLDSVLTFVSALGLTSITDRDAVYWAARATLIRRPEDQPLFDRAFAVFWEHRSSMTDSEESTTESVTLLVDDEDLAGDADSTEHQGETVHLRFSAIETLRDKDFAAYNADELAESTHLMQRLRVMGPRRSSLRLISTRRRGARHDMRATVREALATSGEPLHLRHRTHGARQRRLVVLLDISGSMEPYSRAMLRFMHAALVGRQRVEAFTFGTQLTRLTKELAQRDPDRALARASAQVPDWSGGTRLGESLRTFNDTWGVRGMARGAIVVIVSDGWDRGDPRILAEQMSRLSRVAFRTVWVNPLKVTPGYAPLARGMAAALPYLDDFVEGHSLAALERLADVISAD
jgi:uncharacterized protein with von Willebrand factor type A (vWA) domain